MATKMNANVAKRVKALGISAKSEEEAREALVKKITSEGIDGMEEEDMETLLDIAESFVPDKEEGDDDQDGNDEENENDELAEEVEEEEKPKKKAAPAKKATKKVEEPEEDEDEGDDEEEDNNEEGDEFDGMDRSELKAYIRENELDVTVKKSMSDDDIRELIRAEVGEEDEKPAPKAKASKKPAEKPAPKKEEKKASAKTEKKETKKAAAPKRGTKLDPKNNEADREAFDGLKELFPEDEYAYAWVASAGVTIKHKGKNSQRSMVLIENCSKQADGSIKCNLYLLTFTKQTDVLDKAGIDYEPCWSGAPLIKGITLDEAIEIIEGLMEHITATVQKIDKKLGENRKKMEQNMDKKSSKKPAKKVEEPEEDEDEDDEEEEQPKSKKAEKPVAKKKPAKKVVEEEDEDDEEEDEKPAPKKKASKPVAKKKK